MIAVNTCLTEQETRKVRCPECRGRICDMVIDEYFDCQHKYKVIKNESSQSNIKIKCHKCGLIVGIVLLNI